MPTATEYVDTVSSQINDTLSKIESTTLSAVRSWTETIESSLPDTITTADVVQSLPRPDAVVEMAFDLSRKVVSVQSDVARTVATAVDPTLERFGLTGPAAHPASKTASAPAADGTSSTSTAKKSSGAGRSTKKAAS